MLILGKRAGKITRIWEVSSESDEMGTVLWNTGEKSMYPIGSRCPLYRCLTYWEFFPITEEELTIYKLGGE